MRLLTLLTLLLTSCLSAAVENDQAFKLLENLSKSLRQSNFTTTFVVVKNNNSEPYHWAHGINDAGDELEVLSVLNDAHRDIVRKNDIVSYLESGISPYSVSSHYITSPIPEIFSGDTQKLTENYDLVSVGRSRILGRVADTIRIVSKDPHRYGHRLWLDQESGLLLKLAIIGNQGQVLEQIQVMHLELEEKINPSLQQIENAEFPQVIEAPEMFNNQSHQWQVTWIPKGFSQINANSHRIIHTKQPAEFKMFSDGLVDVSVYVSPSEDQNRLSGFAQEGATLAYNHVLNGLEVSVVGKIPPATAKAIANSVSFSTAP
ncbi:MAG: MucB/RseB C-terminal domain-containing protein [Thalassotalea sp.]